MKTLVVALRLTLVTLLLTGFLYPVLVTGLAQLLFPRQAAGSLVSDSKGTIVGSELIAQGFTQPAYFQPRPSAAGDKGFDATASGGSNLGTTSQKLRDRIAADIVRLQHENPGSSMLVPTEMLTTSASGLDPDISIEAARWQVARVAKARGVQVERVNAVLEANIEGRQLGFLGEPRVNVLLLDMALDRQFGKPSG